MAEIKNSFLKSKMNKDLDDRLIPNGEYRDANNISVGKSEDSDIGALETILGNSLALGSLTNYPAGQTVIGFLQIKITIEFFILQLIIQVIIFFNLHNQLVGKF